MKRPVIGFAGMTHLGVVSAAAAAAKGFRVVGYDADSAVIERLSMGKPPVVEQDLDHLLAKHARSMSFSSDAAALAACDVVYIAADVPTDDEAHSDLKPIRALIDRVAPVLNRRAVLVVLCQVPPGFTRALSFPAGRLYYQVETLVFGRAVERATKPERFIVGCADPSKKLPPAYAMLLKACKCPILPMRYESAELAKISINFCLVASVSVANTLAEVSEAVGGDWSEIAPALKLDARIGPRAYLSPGLGIAGGNLERDLRTVLDIAAEKGTDAGIVRAWLANSAHRKDWTWRTLQSVVLAAKPDARIAVLGLAYKENTHSTKNSPSLALLAKLKGRVVAVHDPVVPASIVPWASGAADPLAAAKGADALVIATPWPHYRKLKPARLKAAMAGRVILDPYRVLDGRACARAGFAYHTLGMPALNPAA
jgi:UDPglucose 6-dehydrogenase